MTALVVRCWRSARGLPLAGVLPRCSGRVGRWRAADPGTLQGHPTVLGVRRGVRGSLGAGGQDHVVLAPVGGSLVVGGQWSSFVLLLILVVHPCQEEGLGHPKASRNERF